MAYLPILVTVFGREIDFRLLHKKAPPAIHLRFEPILTVFSLSQYLKQLLPIYFTPLPMLTVVRLSHQKNAESPMYSTVSGIVTVIISSLPEKTSQSMPNTFFPPKVPGIFSVAVGLLHPVIITPLRKSSYS